MTRFEIEQQLGEVTDSPEPVGVQQYSWDDAAASIDEFDAHSALLIAYVLFALLLVCFVLHKLLQHCQKESVKRQMRKDE